MTDGMDSMEEGSRMVATGYGDVAWPEGEGTWVIGLTQGQSQLVASSTKGKMIWGPAVVVFTRHPQGGVTQTVHDAGCTCDLCADFGHFGQILKIQ